MTPMNTKPPVYKQQRGMMLLEALIAILVFSLGILAMVGMQAISISHTSQSKYRTDASFLANKLIASMWVDSDANMASYATGGARFNTWKTNEIDAYLPPGRSSAIVSVTSFTATGVTVAAPPVTGYTIDITIQWRAPNEDSSKPAHKYQTTTQIIRNAPVPTTV